MKLFKNEITEHNSKNDKYKWKPLGVRYKWDNKSKMKFTEALKNCDIINDISQRIEGGLIDSTGEKIQKLFVDAAKISLDRKKNIRKNAKKS